MMHIHTHVYDELFERSLSFITIKGYLSLQYVLFTDFFKFRMYIEVKASETKQNLTLVMIIVLLHE